MRTRAATAILVLLAAACSSQHRSSPSSAGCRAGGAVPPGVRSSASGPDAVEDAYTLWAKMRGNAEKALAEGAGDPNHGWLDRALDEDGRALIAILGRSDFDAFAAERDELRARIPFVIKPPTPEDRRESMKAIDQGFSEILKRRRGAPAPG